MNHLRIAGILVALVLSAIGESHAQKVRPICGLAVPEEENERDALALQAELGRSELIAAEEIFELLEKLWADEATERMRYLNGKHERDSAKAELALRQARLARQEAYLDWLIGFCSAKSSGKNEQTQDRYFAADCEVRRRDIDLARVEREWAAIWLASIRDLREHSVATRPDIIEAEYDVRMADQRMENAVARVQRCEKPHPASD